MMQHSTDYNGTISSLGMGDRFQLSQHGAVETVAWTDGSVDGSVVYVRTASGDVAVMQTYRRCHVTQYAQRCDCGRRFERCEQGCDWPDELEALFMVS